MAAASHSDTASASGSKRALPGADADADAERRVQPRHSRDGPDPAAAAASSSGVAEAEGPAPAARLHRHALEYIFAFLGLRDAAAALRVSRNWLAAVQSMASLQLTVKKPSATAFAMAESLLGRRHVAGLGSDRQLLAVDADSLFLLARHMPQLRELHCELSLPSATVPLSFPARLVTLLLFVTGSRAAAADVNAVLQAVSRLPLLESFWVRLPDVSNSEALSFAPLVSMPRLREFDISMPRGELSDVQADQLRAMPHLRRLHVVTTSASTLRRLLAQPHQLQWQIIKLPPWLDDEAAALLPQLPSLTMLEAAATCSSFDWLRGLPNLADVRIWARSDTPATLDSLAACLQRCTQLTKLNLNAGLTAAHLAELLPHLPRLQSLTLSNRVLASLSFLSQPAVARSLRSLYLHRCRRLPLSELQHVHSLRGLQSLRLLESFTTPLDAQTQSLYTPPSLLLPRLAKFRWYPE